MHKLIKLILKFVARAMDEILDFTNFTATVAKTNTNLLKSLQEGLPRAMRAELNALKGNRDRSHLQSGHVTS